MSTPRTKKSSTQTVTNTSTTRGARKKKSTTQSLFTSESCLSVSKILSCASLRPAPLVVLFFVRGVDIILENTKAEKFPEESKLCYCANPNLSKILSLLYIFHCFSRGKSSLHLPPRLPQRSIQAEASKTVRTPGKSAARYMYKQQQQQQQRWRRQQQGKTNKLCTFIADLFLPTVL